MQFKNLIKHLILIVIYSHSISAWAGGGLYASDCKNAEPQLIVFLEQTPPSGLRLTFITSGGNVRTSNAKEMRELTDSYGEIVLENNDKIIFRAKDGIKYMEVDYLYAKDRAVVFKGKINGRAAMLERCPDSGSAAEKYAIASVNNSGKSVQQQGLLDLYKTACSSYLNAQKQCATAGDINRCMDILAPGVRSSGIDLALCGFALGR